ncbi:MAG: hypothetical protein M1834_006734 [Cirrosporium novae-zelandiae]|nr:MAG: hypothetical protein M1834_006734 [Cirrosporium novae-zelandiae]
MASSRLTRLAAVISSNTEKLNRYITSHNLPCPSFDVHAPADFPIVTDDPEIQKARSDLILATAELHDLVVGPTEQMRWLAWSHNNSLSLRAMYNFKIANSFPIDAEASYAEIASATGVDEVNVRRLIRHAMTNHIFKESRPGYVAHTIQSRLLAESGKMQDWVGFCVEDMWPAAQKTVDAMRKHPASQEPSEAGFPAAFNCKQPMFMEIGKDPKRAKRFGGAMNSLTGGVGYEVDYLANNYPWDKLKNGTVVDLGGSHGFVSVALAKKYPQLKFVVQDLPKTVVDGPSKIPPDLSTRVTFMAHDFFAEQPVHGADVYLFRWILHNWSDKYSLQILRSLIPALKPGARIVINDGVLPEPNTDSAWDEKITRTMDLVMLTLLNAQERTVSEWKSLFERADPRYKFLGASHPDGCRMWIIEARWDGEKETEKTQPPTNVDDDDDTVQIQVQVPQLQLQNQENNKKQKVPLTNMTEKGRL